MKNYICSVCHNIGKPKQKLSGKKICMACSAFEVLPLNTPRGQALVDLSNQSDMCEKIDKKNKPIIRFVGIFIGLLLIIAIMHTPEVTTSEQGNDASIAADVNNKAWEARAEKSRESLWIIKTQDAVRSRLKDGSSAKFRNLIFVRHEKKPIVCGEVNSKNGFGAYGGFQHFVGSGEALVFLEEEVQDFGTVWNNMCANNG